MTQSQGVAAGLAVALSTNVTTRRGGLTGYYVTTSVTARAVLMEAVMEGVMKIVCAGAATCQMMIYEEDDLLQSKKKRRTHRFWTRKWQQERDDPNNTNTIHKLQLELLQVGVVPRHDMMVTDVIEILQMYYGNMAGKNVANDDVCKGERTCESPGHTSIDVHWLLGRAQPAPPWPTTTPGHTH